MTEENVAEAVIDFCNALEAAIVNLRRQLQRESGHGWNPGAIKWQACEGSKGPYERSEDVNNPEFKAMLRDLADHQGCLNKDRWFYWTFDNGTTVGRKRRE